MLGWDNQTTPMKRLSIALILVILYLPSFGQTGNTKVDSAVIKVTLLGTGTPKPIMERFGPSILVQAGKENLVFDAGRGCLQRLQQLNISYNTLSALFLTHLHSDHIVGIPDLWLTGWLTSQRERPLQVFGPKGTADMLKYLQLAFAYDIKIRVEDDKAVKEGSQFIIQEIQQGVIYEHNGVRVIAFDVDHYPVVPAFGFRIEYKGHSVVLSGDTRFSENLIKYARGTDLLIHEVVIGPDSLSISDPKYSIWAHHTRPGQAARIFNEVKPGMAAFSHIASLYGATDAELLTRTKADYSGPLVIGKDLMSFSIGDSVTVIPWVKK